MSAGFQVPATRQQPNASRLHLNELTPIGISCISIWVKRYLAGRRVPRPNKSQHCRACAAERQ
jgi:hypothetical protein